MDSSTQRKFLVEARRILEEALGDLEAGKLRGLILIADYPDHLEQDIAGKIDYGSLLEMLDILSRSVRGVGERMLADRARENH